MSNELRFYLSNFFLCAKWTTFLFEKLFIFQTATRYAISGRGEVRGSGGGKSSPWGEAKGGEEGEEEGGGGVGE